ncbi:MAG: DUF1761 domain-containing protein [Chthoniobacterales bacterium]
MNPDQINWLAVLLAALSMFLVGGLWYSPFLFGKVWMRANNFTEEQVEAFPKGRAFGGAFLLALVMSANLAMFLADPKTTLTWGMAPERWPAWVGRRRAAPSSHSSKTGPGNIFW